MAEIECKRDGLVIDMSTHDALQVAVANFLGQDPKEFSGMSIEQLIRLVEKHDSEPEPSHEERLSIVSISEIESRLPGKLLTPFEYAQAVYEGTPLDPESDPTDIGYCAGTLICRTDILALDSVQD